MQPNLNILKPAGRNSEHRPGWLDEKARTNEGLFHEYITIAQRKPKWKRKFTPEPINEPRLMVLLGDAVDESPPWDNAPEDEGWRPFPPSFVEAREGTGTAGGYDIPKNPVSALQQPQIGHNGPIEPGRHKTGTVSAGM